MSDLPNISILTPTFDRKQFLQLMITNVCGQDYPKDKLEWTILDSWGRDGTKCEPMLNDREIKEISNGIAPIKLNYHFVPKKMDIGEKRNKLVKLSSNKIFVNMDSDDIYLSSYVKTLVPELKGKVSIAGSPEMMFVYPLHNYQYSFIRCPSYRQIHEGAMGFTLKHFRRMGGFETSGTGEGAGMFDGCGEQCFKKVDITKLMCCVCHENNTCNKDRFLEHKVEAEVQGAQMDFLKKMYPPVTDDDTVIVEKSSDSD